jgi:hypothetical protein
MVHERTNLSRGTNDDVISTDVRRTTGRTTRIINIDDHRHTQSGEIPGRILNWQGVIRQGGAVLAGDFNADCS